MEPLFWALGFGVSILAMVSVAVYDNSRRRIRAWHREKWRNAGRPRPPRSPLEIQLDQFDPKRRSDWIEEPGVTWGEFEDTEPLNRARKD